MISPMTSHMLSQVRPFFEVVQLPRADLDPVYSCDDVAVWRLRLL